ncbi:MAG TPA: hypothetical protein VFC38_10275 [Stellaceae bacterium]|nr:hypothetical protein [Stellaceae bacterium]
MSARCCEEAFVGSGTKAGDVIANTWRAGCRGLIARVAQAAAILRERRKIRATWRDLRLLDERSLAELGVTPGAYWNLDRQHRFR